MKWNAALYDGKHGFVSALGQSIAELANVGEGDNVLDVGCGTGDWCQQFAEKGANVTGVDASNEMIDTAKQKYPALNFTCMDAAHMNFNQNFDIVFSNAALHWMKDAEKVLGKITQALKLGGTFVAEFGGKYNCLTIRESMLAECEEQGYSITTDDFPWYFPSIGEYTALMEKVGLDVTYAQHFERSTLLDGEQGVAQWVRMFGGAITSKIPPVELESFLTNVQKRTESKLYRDGNWYADYWRIQVIGVRKM
ncbi:MAG: class I SAM-dependent methyltransferase [Bacilli bacterium]